jgi:hypothetical protein
MCEYEDTRKKVLELSTLRTRFPKWSNLIGARTQRVVQEYCETNPGAKSATHVIPVEGEVFHVDVIDSKVHMEGAERPATEKGTLLIFARHGVDILSACAGKPQRRLTNLKWV